MRIFIADPDEATCRFLQSLLEEAGHEADYATNGLEAMMTIENRPPDFILMDMYMAVVDGLALGYVLSNDPLTCSIPLAVMSDRWDPALRLWARNNGLQRCIEKPIRTGDILAAVRRDLAQCA